MALTGKKVKLGKRELTVSLDTYAMNGATSVDLLEKGKQFARLSVNFIGTSDKLKKNEFYVKDWSENQSIVSELVSTGQLVPVSDYPAEPSTGAKVYRLKD
jgi:hypothetical protein